MPCDVQTSKARPSSGKRASRSVAGIIGNAILLLYSITCIFPAVWLAYSSMKTMNEFTLNPVALPRRIDFSHYVSVLTTTDMLRWLGNTARTTLISLVFILLIGFVVGYFLSRFKFKGRNFIYAYFMLGILIPIHAIMVPMYVLFNNTSLVNRWYSLLPPYISFGLPIAIFLVESGVRKIPREIEEAAAIDGASFSRTMFGIIMPMSMPVLTTVGIIQFFTCWNEFSFALILINNSRLLTVPVGLTLFSGQHTTDYPRMMTAMILAMLPAVLLYFTFSKQIIKGMVAGAIKG